MARRKKKKGSTVAAVLVGAGAVVVGYLFWADRMMVAGGSRDPKPHEFWLWGLKKNEARG